MLPRRRPRGSLHDGISLNFATGRYFTKAQGGPANIQPLTSLFTFTGGNQSMYMGPAGLLVQSVTNTPRIEYDASGNCLGLLMEASRTNLAIQSFNLSAYVLTGVTIGSNVIAGPDGAVTADSMIEDASTGLHRAGGTSVGVANTVNTVSFFFKAGTRTRGRIRMGGASGSTLASFNTVAQTITPATPSGNGTCTGATITALPNGWFRVTATGVPDSTSGATFQPSCDLDDGSGTFSYTGTNATIGAYCTGFQVEAASFASSYIPTTTVSVARTADSCFRTLGSEFSATAGTVVVQGRASGGQDASLGQAVFSFDDGTLNERFCLTRSPATDTANYIVTDGGVAQAVLGNTFTNSTAFKACVAFAANDAAVSFNGNAIQTDATVTLPTVTTLNVGGMALSTQMNGHILRFDYWPSRLPNTYLVSAST